MVMSDFRQEVEIRSFCACAMKNTQYNAYLWLNRGNSRVLKEIGVEEHDGEVRFQTGSGNITLSFMCHASGHNYRNSSFIVDVAMGQIPHSTERISSFKWNCACVENSSLQADSRPKSLGFVWVSITWRCSSFIRWTGWTLAMICQGLWHNKNCSKY